MAARRTQRPGCSACVAANAGWALIAVAYFCFRALDLNPVLALLLAFVAVGILGLAVAAAFSSAEDARVSAVARGNITLDRVNRLKDECLRADLDLVRELIEDPDTPARMKIQRLRDHLSKQLADEADPWRSHVAALSEGLQKTQPGLIDNTRELRDSRAALRATGVDFSMPEKAPDESHSSYAEQLERVAREWMVVVDEARKRYERAWDDLCHSLTHREEPGEPPGRTDTMWRCECGVANEPDAERCRMCGIPRQHDTGAQ